MAAQAAAAARRASNATIRPGGDEDREEEDGQKLNLAQKLLLGAHIYGEMAFLP